MKRLIYTLYFNESQFCLSRNFNLQSVGDVDWLHDNYGFGKSSHYIDELIILNVSRKYNDDNNLSFIEAVKKLTRDIFIPIGLGSGIRSLKDAKSMFDIGADKIVINSQIFRDPKLLLDIKEIYGSQSIICSIDLKNDPKLGPSIYINSGNQKVDSLENLDFSSISPLFGELMVHSIDKDGTGEGFDFEIAKILESKNLKNQVIFSGGAGKPDHFKELFKNYPWISGVATGNLFNFLGTGLKDSRMLLIEQGIQLPDFF